MGTASMKPKWWTAANHESAWDRVKEALKRDWEQTKSDLSVGGDDLHQDVDDTVKQAVGTDVVPPRGVPTAPGGSKRRNWTDVEASLRYGVGARAEYKKPWNEVEHVLRGEWSQFAVGETWEDVHREVRRGYESGARKS